MFTYSRLWLNAATVGLWHRDLALSNSLWDSVLGHPSPNSQPGGCSSSHQRTACPKKFLNPQPPLHMPLTHPCTPEGQDPALFTRGQAETPSTKDFMSPQTSLIHHGAVTRDKKVWYCSLKTESESEDTGQNLQWNQLVPGPW